MKIKEKVLKEMLEDSTLSEKEKKLIDFDPRIKKVIDLTLAEVGKVIDKFKFPCCELETEECNKTEGIHEELKKELGI